MARFLSAMESLVRRSRALHHRLPAATGMGLVGLCTSAHGQIWEKLLLPGLTYRMEVSQNPPRILHAIRFSPHSDWITARPELSRGKVYSQDVAQSRATISQAIKSTGAIAGINGDFFPFTGDPLGLMIRAGELLSAPYPKRSAFGWGQSALVAGPAVMSATYSSAGGPEFPIPGLNQECGDNMLCLNTEAAGFARAKGPCLMAVLQIMEGAFTANGLVRARVVGLGTENNVAVAPGSAILVATGNRMGEIGGLLPGAVLSISLKLSAADWGMVENAIGGGPQLLRAGRILNDWAWQGFNEAFSLRKHPRTAIGRTGDGDIWFMAIDGRQETGEGATLEETAILMKRLGCVDAINLDGGGSTTINLFGLLMNRPSDGTERPVANGVLFFKTSEAAKRTFNPATMNVSITAPDTVKLKDRPQIKAFFENGSRISDRDIVWACSGSAWIDQGGVLHPLNPGTATVWGWVSGKVASKVLTIQ